LGGDAELREGAREVLEARACARHARSPSPRDARCVTWCDFQFSKLDSFDFSEVKINEDK